MDVPALADALATTPEKVPPPRLAVRTVLVTFSAIAVILVAVVLVLVVELRDRATRSVFDNLSAGQRIITVLLERRDREVETHALELARDLNIGFALHRLQTEPRPTDDEVRAFAELVERQVHQLGDRIRLDAVAVVDRERHTVVRSGRDAREWPVGKAVALAGPVVKRRTEAVYRAGGSLYRVLIMPIQAGDDLVGEVHLASALDANYAETISSRTRAHTIIAAGKELVACTLPAAQCAAVGAAAASGRLKDGIVPLAGDSWAVKRVLRHGYATVFAVDPLSGVRRAATREAWVVLGSIGLAALALGALASLWLARTISRPIDDLSRTLADMAASRRFNVRLPRPGTSRELDALTDTFNELMRSLATAESETRSAYVGAIRALAAALDARDPYTAGHSERVSALAVSIARHMALPEREVDVLRLGALLHDIGKIGVSDNVLRKPGPLTTDEFEAIKTHPKLGSRILRSVPFLAPHLPIVELHHERPDGQGYPHGLVADEIPVLARIVRVADAFDAMTSARAYRPARPSSEAITELWHHAGSHFDTEVVEAFVAVWPTVGAGMVATDWPGAIDTTRLRAVVSMHGRRG